MCRWRDCRCCKLIEHLIDIQVEFQHRGWSGQWTYGLGRVGCGFHFWMHQILLDLPWSVGWKVILSGVQWTLTVPRPWDVIYCQNVWQKISPSPKNTDLTNYLPIVLHWEEKIKHRRIAGFLEKGILAQYHNILQMICNCFGTNILNWGTQIYATVSEQISGWQIFTEFWHNITFTKRRLLGRTSPCQGELLHPESSNVSNGDEESRWEWCVEKTSVLLRVASLTCPREKSDSNGKHDDDDYGDGDDEDDNEDDDEDDYGEDEDSNLPSRKAWQQR